MAQKNATVYAGEQANGVADCAAVVNRLLAKGYAGTRYGHDGNLPTASNFTDGKNRTFMYWSSHGNASADDYRVVSGSLINVKNAMASWDTGDPCEAMMFASCYAFMKASYVRHFYDSMKSSKVFVICGYGVTAPAGTDTDVKIANKFFDGLDEGLGIVYAWRAANQSYAKSSWGAMSYGTTSANCNFTLPGWGNNTGISRSQPIWCLKQDYAGIYQPSSATANVVPAELPYEITLADATIPMNYARLGTGNAFAGDTDMINYRRDGVEKMDAKDIPAIANDALKVLGLEDLLKDAEVLFAPITVSEVTDEGIGEEFSIGGDIVYQQRYNGVEIENNFVRICVDKDGVYRLVNKWKPVAAKRAVVAGSEQKAKISSADAIKKLSLDAGVTVQGNDLVYIPDADGTYKLCHKIELSDGKRHYVNSLTGEVQVRA